VADRSLAEMERRLAVGRDYLAALMRLGFQPDAAAWALVDSETESRRFELAIITHWVDTIGSLPIYELLFEAYRSGATPREIDPFNVSLFSPKAQLADDLAEYAAQLDKAHDPAPRPMGASGYVIAPSWILIHRPAPNRRHDDLHQFAAFKTNVAQLAA
jgi:hypothetical protein